MSEAKRTRIQLSESITETQFANNYWYARDLKEFATRIGVQYASKLRKDELERAILHFIRKHEVKTFVTRTLTRSGVKDVEKGLRLDLPVVNYTSTRVTKDFIDREAAKCELRVRFRGSQPGCFAKRCHTSLAGREAHGCAQDLRGVG
jgi:hypothetical protein